MKSPSKITTLFIAILFLSTFESRLNAQTERNAWNQFRGPNGQGAISDATIPSEFGPEKNLIWRTELPNGFSSPVIHEGRVYLTAEKDDNLFTICVEESSGKELWRKQAPRERTEKLDPRNHPAAPSPFVDGNSVFVFFPDYGLIAYQIEDGTEKWKTPLGPFTNLYGMGASPIVVNGLVVLMCDQNLSSFVAAFDRETGKEVWKTLREEATSGHCTPIVFRPSPNEPAQLLCAGSFNLTSYDAKSGKKLWFVGGLCFEMKSTPVMTKDTIYVNGFGSPQNEQDQSFDIAGFTDVVTDKDANGDGVLSMEEMPDDLAKNFFGAVDLDNDKVLNAKEWKYFRNSVASKNSIMAIRIGGEGDMTSKSTLWKYHKNIPQLPSPVLVGNQLVMISDRGIVTSLDPNTGEEKFKSRIAGAAGNYYASPIVAGQQIIFANTKGQVSVINAGDNLDVISVNDLGEQIYATPAIHQDRLYVRTTEALYCFGDKQ